MLAPNKVIAITAVALVAVFVFLGGFYIGTVVAGKLPIVNLSDRVALQLSSGVVSSVVVSGIVVYVDEAKQEVSISSNNQVVTVPMRGSAPVFLMGLNQVGVPQRDQVDFASVAGGQSVTIGVTITPEGNLVGENLNILPRLQ